MTSECEESRKKGLAIDDFVLCLRNGSVSIEHARKPLPAGPACVNGWAFHNAASFCWRQWMAARIVIETGTRRQIDATRNRFAEVRLFPSPIPSLRSISTTALQPG